MKFGQYKVSLWRILLVLLIAGATLTGYNMIEADVMDDQAVLALNSPSASRDMVRYEQVRGNIIFTGAILNAGGVIVLIRGIRRRDTSTNG